MAKKLWGGRFKKETAPSVENFTKSIDYDHKLALYDVLGSITHVGILENSGFLEEDEAEKLTTALDKIFKDILDKKFEHDKNTEDIHTDIQNRVEKEVGELALKLHTARSRNDQVVFDLKIFCKIKLGSIKKLCDDLKKVLSDNSKKYNNLIMPGYTHMQHAQLIRLSDYLGSYCDMLGRDIERLEKTNKNIILNMGAGALAGTPIDAETYSKGVKEFFKKTPEIKEAFDIKENYAISNSIDAVSNRDFVIETLSSLAILGMHLSRLAEDLIIFSTKEFNFVELDDAFTTGSSLMPQKKNPDVLELVRGYTGILYGNLMSVLTTMKGLPLTYNRDLQLDKPPLFSSFEIIEGELKVLTDLIKTLKWNKDVIEKAVDENETLYATDFVYYLVKKGVAFREAHDIIGKLVKYCLDNKKKIKDIPESKLKEFSDKLKKNEIIKIMNPLVSVNSRISVKRKK
jgi:argininosuccinate lyase